MNRIWKFIKEIFHDDGSWGKIEADHIRRVILLYYRRRD